ncbi:amidohydrolase family protein [Candidatus Bathyarchaeota archaeon]|nr:amidohydrolase family protein [Candidatus Bathyarchaeota archaeon]
MVQNVLIKDGKVVDGTGAPWFKGDVGFGSGVIRQVGRIDPADYDVVIDAGGLVVSPGFIDVHSHSDLSLLVNPEADSFIRQGVTTVFNGNCGNSAAPLNETSKKHYEESMGVSVDWLTTAEYFNAMESRGVAINAATFTGLSNLLVSAMGMDAYDRPSTNEELEQMKGMLRQAMEMGSYGLSSGLEYDPQTLTGTDTLVELCREVAEYGGIYATHIRSRDVKVVEAAREAVEIGERSGVAVEGVHWGARFPSDGKTKHIVDLFDAARLRRLDVGFNQVPWTVDDDGVGWCGCALYEPIVIGSKYTKKGAEFTYEMLRDPEVVEHLKKDLPNRQYGPILAGRRGLLDSWDRFLVAHTDKSPEYNGMNLKQIGKQMRKDPFDALIEILVKEGEGFNRAWGAVGITSRWDTEFSLLHPNCSVAIDSGNDSPRRPLSEEPVGELTTRAYGQYPYFFEKWVREDRALSLEDAVRKCTGLPAQRMRVMDRGLLRPWQKADVLVWDPDKIKNNASWENPRVYPSGICMVYVNGVLAVEDNEHTGALNGEVLRAR